MTMLPLHRGQLSVLRVRYFTVAGALVAAFVALDIGPIRETPLPFGVASGAMALLLIAWASWSPARRYRSWGYKVAEDELHLRHGIWTRIRTIVPFSRVQHIDVAQGPVERQFGVARLILHTAGTSNSNVTLPGLAMEEAGRISDLIRGQIRQDLV